MRAFHLRTEHMKNPMGLMIEHPLLSWQCEPGMMQTAYRIQVFEEESLVWDSGKTDSDRIQANYPGELQARMMLSWKVLLWNESGAPGEWSDTAFFETGLEKKDWAARWIDPEENTEPDVRKPAGYLKKRFTLQQSGAARLYCTAHGLYCACLNGKRIGEDVLTPGCDEYTKRLAYQVYDVTDLLVEGENQIEVILGDGWYRGCNGIDGVRNLFGGDLSFLAQLEIAGKPVLVTDESWEASSDGPIRLCDLELGEIYDARMEQITAWHPVRVHEFGYEALVAANSVPVREHEVFQGTWIKTPSGETVCDFGQNLAGYTELRVNAKAGQKIVLVHGETLDENGNFTIANFQPGDRNQSGGIKQEIEYICKDGQNVYKPSFSIFGYRYVKVVSEIPTEDIELLSHAVYSDMEETAAFTCSDEAVNRLFYNSIWSMKSNFCDVPTDCPTRERAGWTGDAGVFAPTGSMLMDCYPVFRKWLANVRVNQHEDGKMAYISPTNGKGSQISEMFSASVGWGDASVLVPYALYRTYGDAAILEENYDMMKKWVDFLTERAKQSRTPDPFADNPYQDYIINTGMDYGEWCEPGANVMETMQRAFAFGQPEVATAYFANSARLLGEIADVLGHKEDCLHYRELAKKARLAYQSICVKDGHIASERQCEYVRPIAFGLLEPEQEAQAAADLNALVIKNGYHLNTGFLSTPYLCEVLAGHGYTGTAYRLLLQRECPGWLYAVEKGATTIWETWDGIREDGTVHDSLNHYSYGAIAGWLLSGVCGIKYTGESLVLAPVVDKQLAYARAKFDSPRGQIVSEWEYDSKTDGFRYHFEIPGNVRAKIVLPDGREQMVTSGVYDF